MRRPGRPTDMRRPLLVTLLGLFALTTWPSAPEVASASCAAPYLELERDTLKRGASVTVEGRAFTHGCQDSMGCTAGLGCDSCEYDEPAPIPMQDVSLRLVQGARTWRLDTANAAAGPSGDAGWITWRFIAPPDAEAGRAQSVPDNGEPFVVRIR